MVFQELNVVAQTQVLQNLDFMISPLDITILDITEDYSRFHLVARKVMPASKKKDAW